MGRQITEILEKPINNWKTQEKLEKVQKTKNKHKHLQKKEKPNKKNEKQPKYINIWAVRLFIY